MQNCSKDVMIKEIPKRLFKRIEKPVSQEFTVLTYNTLAEDGARKEWFPQTSDTNLKWSWRCERIVQELRSFGADFVCLQEIQKNSLQERFIPELGNDKQSYDMIYHQKKREAIPDHEENTRGDGVLILYLKSKWKLEKVHYVDFTELAREKNQFVEGTHSSTDVNFKDCILKTHNVGLIAQFWHKETKNRIIVSNTHLYWDSKRPDIKLFQIYQFLDAIYKFQCSTNYGLTPDNALKTSANMKIPVIFCGDLNSTGSSEVIQYIQHGGISGKMWNNLIKSPIWNPTCKESLNDLKLFNPFYEHNIQLKSAYRSDTLLPKMTCTHGTIIDWIFYTNNYGITLTGLYDPLFPNKNIEYLPNENHPSDHLPLCASYCFQK